MHWWLQKHNWETSHKRVIFHLYLKKEVQAGIEIEKSQFSFRKQYMQKEYGKKDVVSSKETTLRFVEQMGGKKSRN